jgi:hypothetical protein
VPALGHIALTALTRQQCHAFTLSLLDKKLSHSSRVGILTTLSAVLTAAVDDPSCPLQLHPSDRPAQAPKAGFHEAEIEPKTARACRKCCANDVLCSSANPVTVAVFADDDVQLLSSRIAPRAERGRVWDVVRWRVRQGPETPVEPSQCHPT